MKKNEMIELNGVEYTLELNRDSFLQIDKICNVQESMKTLQKAAYDYIDDIDDNYNPLEDIGLEDSFENSVEEKSKVLEKLIVRSFFIWLYPNHKLTISQVKEILKPYLENQEKAEWISEKLSEYLEGCVKMRETYLQEQKNLQAQANK